MPKDLNTALSNETGKPTEQRNIETITAEIHNYNRQFGESAHDVGRLLIEAKGQLEHGKWLEWLRNRVEFSEATARRFMRIAKEYPNRSTVTDLGFSKAVVLLNLPTEERNNFINVKHMAGGKEKTIGEMSCRELRELFRDKSSSVTVQEDDSDEEGIADPKTAYHKSGFDLNAYVQHLQEHIDGMLEYIENLEDDLDRRDGVSITLRAVCEETLKRLPQVEEAEAEAS